MRKMYSKGQIKEMVQNGATKLYQHIISVDNEELLVLNNSEESLVGQSIIDLYTEVLFVRYSGDGGQYIISTDGDTILYYVSSVGSISSLELDELEITADEVTAL